MGEDGSSTMPTAVILIALIAAGFAAGCSQDVCPGLTDCSGVCADLLNDPKNCGGCGIACAEGQICFEGTCSAAGCIDECPTPGAIGCADPPGNGPVMCADFYDDDRCLEWGDYSPCNEGETCVDGACSGGCDNECEPEGGRRCEGAGFRECGQHDADPCLEWGEVVACGEGTTCSDGACSAGCVDDCAEGESACEDNVVWGCGRFDDDPCLDWSPVEECGADRECRDGACVESRCLDEYEDCVCGENQCCEGHCCPFFFICIPWDPQEDWCPNGPGPHG
jgi:hypothetical protein